MKSLSVTELMKQARDTGMSDAVVSQLIAYNSTIYVDECKRAFYKDFAKLQAELPIIEKNETVTFRDGRTGTYAPNDEIQEIIGPILRKHGFVLAFSTSYPEGMIRVTGELTHKDGHSTQSHYEAKVDMSGGKTDAQGRGSIISYGHRYTTIDLLNLITRGKDTDGAQVVIDTPKPEGYDEFMRHLWEGAATGISDLTAAFANANQVMREAVPQAQWDELKATAERVTLACR